MPIGFQRTQGISNGTTFRRQAIVNREYRDRYRRYVTDYPSPEKFATLLKNAEWDIGSLCELQEEIEAKNGHVRGIATTRRMAFCGLEWDIEPDPESPNQKQAGVVADYVRKALRDVKTVYPDSGLPPKGFTDALRFLATAIGPNVAAMELVWQLGRLVEMRPVPGHRLTVTPQEGRLAVETNEYSTGLPLDFAPNKFVVHSPEPRAGFITRSTMTHASAWLYLIGHFSWKDWMAFSELYGMPWRVGKFTGDQPDVDRDTFKAMLENLGPDFAAIIPADWDVETHNVTGNGETYQKQLDKAEATLSILWLGQTLTTDIGDVGSRAAAEVHDNVRKDLLQADLQDEAAMVRDQIIRPMVRLAFPNQDAPVPVFRRLLNERTDTQASELRIQQIETAKTLGLPLMTDEVYEGLGLTRPPSMTTEVIETKAMVIPPILAGGKGKEEDEPEKDQDDAPNFGN